MADLPTLSPGDRDPARHNTVTRQAVQRLLEVQETANSAAQSATQIIAGAGLTGGGTLAADRTLTVGAGTGISVNADDVAVATNGVTNTLLADMATKTYKGRTSGGTGDPEDVAVATVRSDISAEQIGVTAGIVDRTNSTLALSDIGTTVFSNDGSANTITVPANATVAFPTSTYINLLQAGAGQTTITAAVGVTIRAYNGALKLAGQNAMATLLKTDTNTWYASGNLTT